MYYVARKEIIMISFLLGIVLLIVGYMTYGKIVERFNKPDDRTTSVYALQDGVDYILMSLPRVFLIQLLNIAGLGPIFGAISGAIWGPVVYLWIVFGTIFAGGVHDYLSGMMSERNNGASISEIVGKYLGPIMANVMRVFSVVLLVMVGVVFLVGPAQLIALLTPSSLGVQFWTVVILVYYFLATLLPIDKIIGRIYPIFGLALIIMAIGIGGATLIHNGERPMLELWDHFKNMYPGDKQLPVWPLMFITVACGAISGFHATQSPIIARCLKSGDLGPADLGNEVDAQQGGGLLHGRPLGEVDDVDGRPALADQALEELADGLDRVLHLQGDGAHGVVDDGDLAPRALAQLV